MGFHALVNTAYFSEAAKDWKKNGGKYTDAPRGSSTYRQYWEEQTKRCIEGYSVADLWIPGKHYFYLNFFPMSKVPDHVLKKALDERRNARGFLSQSTAEKLVGFPNFWEIDYEWWNFKHIAWYGGTFMGIKSPGGRHMSCLKTRGSGFSYKEAADGVHNYTFIDGSKSYYFAGAEPYLIGDAIMDKVQGGLDWVNEHCLYWKKNRHKINVPMHRKASYVDAEGVERGSFSEIIAQVVDKASKTRGKRGVKASFEEAGSFPHLEKALRVSMGSMSEGNVYVGQISVFGTGGEKGPGIQGLENIFYAPEAWDMLAFPNIWEEGMYGSEIGYYCPQYRADSWFMDENGNVDLPAAIAADDKVRKKVLSSGRPKDLDDRKAEYSRTPTEALQRMTGNGFNRAEIDKQIRLLQVNKRMQAMITYCDLVREDTGVGIKTKPKYLAKPIEDYPHNETDDLTGSCAFIQRPYKDSNGQVPDDMYFITFDAYYKEESQSLTSLFSFKVWKQYNKFDNTLVELPVFWYAGRPTRLDNNHDIMFMASELFNAKIQGEIAGGGQGVVNYAKTHRKLNRLKHEPGMVHNKELASKGSQGAFLMNMSTERKKQGMIYLEDWHVRPRNVDGDGNIILNVHQIYDIAWLREMRKHDPEDKKQNTDRISDAIIAMYELKENIAMETQRMKKAQKEKKPKRNWYAGTGNESGTVSMY